MAKREQLSTEDLQKLWTHYHESPSREVRHKLMLQYIGLVKYVLNSMNLATNAVLDHDDLLQIGIIGLHDAFERFEIQRGIKFETFAVPRIRGIILDEVRKVDFLSRTARKRSQDFLQAADQLRSEKGRDVSSEEVLVKLGVSPDEYKIYLRAAAAATSSLSLQDSQMEAEENSSDEDSPTRGIEAVADHEQESILDKMEREEVLNFIVKYLQKIPERQRLVMTLYYYESLTFKEIGMAIGITESRVCQIHTSVCNDLKKRIQKL